MYNASLLTTGHFYRPPCERVLRAQLKETRVKKVHYRWHYGNRGIALFSLLPFPAGVAANAIFSAGTSPPTRNFFFQRKSSVWREASFVDWRPTWARHSRYQLEKPRPKVSYDFPAREILVSTNSLENIENIRWYFYEYEDSLRLLVTCKENFLFLITRRRIFIGICKNVKIRWGFEAMRIFFLLRNSIIYIFWVYE